LSNLVFKTFNPDIELDEEDHERITFKDKNAANCSLDNLQVKSQSNINNQDDVVHPNQKPIYQMDIETGGIITRFEGAKEASEKMGFDYKRQGISNAAFSQREYKGYKWAYCQDIDADNEDNDEEYTNDLPNEKWQQIEGLNYFVSTRGRIMHGKRKRIRKHKIKPDGTHMVSLRVNKQVKDFFVHILEAKAFIPNPNNLPEVNHIDEDRDNLNIENLEWVSRSQNASHSFAKRVNQYELDGTFRKSYASITEASQKTGFAHSGISKCCSGKQNECHGFIWKYSVENEDDDEGKIIEPQSLNTIASSSTDELYDTTRMEIINAVIDCLLNNKDMFKKEPTRKMLLKLLKDVNKK